MTIQIKYEPSEYLPLWRFNLMNLEQKTYRWIQIGVNWL